MISLFRVEMSKQLRRTRTYVAFGILVVLPVVMTLAVRYGDRGNRPDQSPDALFQLARRSGLIMPAAALAFMSRLFLLAVVVALFAGDSVAGEASTGNLRYVLVRPIARARVLTAKLLTSFVFMVAATLVIVLTGLIAGGIFIGWHRIDIDITGFFSFHESVSQIIWHLLVAAAYVAWSMTSVVALALMVSTMTDAASGAIGAGIGLYVVSSILDAIPQLGALRYGFPTHYLDDWRSLIVQNHASSDLIRGVVVQIPYVVVFAAIAYWWFGRKDVLS